MSAKLQMSRPDVGEAEIEAVVEVLKSGILSIGPRQEQFEQAFADYVGTKHAVAVSSGTAGLHLAVLCAGIGEGDEVITSPFSFVSSANCMLFERARPVFADINEESLTLDPEAAANALSDRTRGVLPVHVFGQACEMDPLLSLCERHKLILIEDACEAIGTEYRGRKVGGFGQTAVFSFYPNKQMTTGEGAVVTTNDTRVARLLRSLRNQGRSAGGAWLTHDRLGFNYRMSELSAALGAVQIGRIDAMLAKRETVANLYRAALEDVPGVRLIHAAPWTTRLSWFAAIARLDEGIDRDAVIERLEDLRVPSRAYFAPLHLQPLYRKLYGHATGDFPIAERVSRSTVALPFHSLMDEASVAAVCDALRRVI